MANSNVNIGQRLFAYIEHGADVNENITTQYANSLLFIGDQQQIFVPAMHAYVGIGMTAYNDTIHGIKNVEDAIETLAGTLTSALVSKIYPNFNQVYYSYVNNNSANSANAVTASYLTQEVTIRGIGDYDTTTQLAYTKYKVTNGSDTYEYAVDPTTTKNGKYASSGITVSWSTTPAIVDAVSGEVTKAAENYLNIDDTLTWSYIANAYTYTMTWAQKYVANEMERMYHNLLGDASQYVIADREYAFIKSVGDNTDEGTQEALNTSVTFYYKQKCDASDTDAIKHVDPVNGTIYYKYVQYDGGTKTDALDYYSNDNIPVLYYISNEYNGTYNINITDGINTLKEVAYLFDVMTDGYGTPTYITKAEYNNLGDKTGYYLTFTNDATEDDYANDDVYAYYITYDAENLGIQMAYSLNSLKMEINDVHNQTGLLETGDTTLRSIVMQGSKFVTVSMQGSNRVTPTDQNNVQNHADNYVTGYWNAKLETAAGNPTDWTTDHWYGNTYTLGDANISLQLKYTQTYLTSQVTTGLTGVAFNDYVAVGGKVYQKADMSNLETIGGDTDVTYYTSDGTTVTAVENSNVVTDPHKNGNLQYWWLPSANAEQSQFVNSKKITVDKVYLMNHSDSYFWVDNGTTVVQMKSSDITAAWDTYKDATIFYVDSTSSKDIVLHPVLEVTDAIATAAWTTAYINNALQGITSELDDILDKAKQYTDDKIDALDSNSLYDDFEKNVWNTYTSAGHNGEGALPGTDSYNTMYENMYKYYTGETTTKPDEDSAVKTATEFANSNINRSKSEFVVSITEEDGIVTTTTRELPAAYVAAHAEVWGESTSSVYQRQYEALDYAGITSVDENGNTDPTIGATSAQKLWNFVHTKTYDNNLYVESTEKDYEIINNVSEYDSLDATTAFFYDQATGVYRTMAYAITNNYDWAQDVTIEENGTINRTDKAPSDLKGTNGTRFIQLYKEIKHYAECDLETIVWNADYSKVTGITAEGVNYTAADGIQFYYIKGLASDAYETTSDPRTNAPSNKYITAKYEHFTYTSGSHGENNIDIAIHLTHLEDATRTNTGLADAYDVKQYVDDYFNWVNLSATINANNISTNSVWYTQISYEWWDAHKTDSTIKYYSRADENDGTPYTETTISAADYTTEMGITKFTRKIYIKEQTEFYNPLNLTLTKYTKKVYDF